MEIQEALKWTDDLIFAKTGKHLDSLQRAILEGTWEFRGYKDIADNYHCSPDHVRKMASELWELLSELLGEDVKKKNVRSILENGIFSYFSDGVNIGNNIIFCGEVYNHPQKSTERSATTSTSKESQPRHDLSEAPEYDNRLYDRTDELTTLKQWILTENSRIVTVTGLSGMGKTTLARQLVEQIRDNFDCILWRTHRKFPTLNALKANLIEFFSPTHKSENPSIINYLQSRHSILDDLRSHRCLIILDDFQDTLTPRQFVGNYLPGYENYGKLITEIGRSSRGRRGLYNPQLPSRTVLATFIAHGS
ncbi:WD-repeat protein (fragment) [Planktothrix paucivesiculata PCC 9631]|uniref:WD-repeat protein n=1 Tax=Planktothrix paucivesiculata PCC 9631 TaxID=671071 RepID=A0A7Z9BX50_9CYAN